MNYLDLIFGGLLVFGGIRGFIKGFIIEAASLIALVFGLVGSLLFVDFIDDSLKSFLNPINIPPKWIVFLLIFTSILIITSLIAKLLTKIIKIAFLGNINKILGALFGLLKIALILSAIIIAIDQFAFLFDFMEKNIIQESLLYSPIKDFGIKVLEWLSNTKNLLPEENYNFL